LQASQHLSQNRFGNAPNVITIPGGGFPGGGRFPGNGGFPGNDGFPGNGGFPGGNNNMGGQNMNQAPLSPPPNNIPTKNANQRFVDPGSIRNCMGRFTYIWLDNGAEFWMFPVQLSKRSVSGFRWNRSFGWVYFWGFIR